MDHFWVGFISGDGSRKCPEPDSGLNTSICHLKPLLSLLWKNFPYLGKHQQLQAESCKVVKGEFWLPNIDRCWTWWKTIIDASALRKLKTWLKLTFWPSSCKVLISSVLIFNDSDEILSEVSHQIGAVPHFVRSVESYFIKCATRHLTFSLASDIHKLGENAQKIWNGQRKG